MPTQSPSSSLPERRQREDEPNTPQQQPHHVMTQPVFLQKIFPFATVSPLRLKSVSSSWSETIVHYSGATICWINFFNKQKYKEELLIRCIKQALKLCSDSLWIVDSCCEVASALDFEVTAPNIHHVSNGKRYVYLTELGESLYGILSPLLRQLSSSSTWNAALLNKFIRAVMFRIISLAEIEEIFTFSAEDWKGQSYDRTLLMYYCSNEDACCVRVMTEVFKLIDEMKMNELIINNGSHHDDGSALETNHEECSSYVIKQMKAKWRCGECCVEDCRYCDFGGHTPLMHAIASSSLEIVKFLVSTFREMEIENRYLIHQLQIKSSTEIDLLLLAFSSNNCENKRAVLIFLIDTMCSLDDGGQLFSEQVFAAMEPDQSGRVCTPLYLACFHDMPEVVSHLNKKVREVCGDEALNKLLQLRVSSSYKIPSDGYFPIHIACSRASVATVESIMSAAESLGKEFLDDYLQSLCRPYSDFKKALDDPKSPLLCCLEHRGDDENMLGKLRVIVKKIRSSLGINSLRKQFDLIVSPSLPDRLTLIEIECWGFEQVPFAATDFLVFEFIEDILGDDAFRKFLELQQDERKHEDSSFVCYAFSSRSLGYCKRLVEKIRTKFGDEFLANQLANGKVFREAVFASSVRILEYLVAVIRSVVGSEFLAKQFDSPPYDLLRGIMYCRVYTRMPRFLTDLILEVSGKEILSRYFDADKECPDEYSGASVLEIGAKNCMYSRDQDDFVKMIFVLSRLPFIASETAKALLMEKGSQSLTVLGVAVRFGNSTVTRYVLQIIEKVGGEELLRDQFSCAASSSDGRPLLYLALLNGAESGECRRVVRLVISMMKKLFSYDVFKTMFAMTSYTVSPPVIWNVRESNSLDIFCSVFREVDPDGYEQQLKELQKMTRDDDSSSAEKNKVDFLKDAIAALEKKYADEEIIDDTLGEIDPDGTIAEMIDGVEVESNADDTDYETSDEDDSSEEDSDEEDSGEDCAVGLSEDDQRDC